MVILHLIVLKGLPAQKEWLRFTEHLYEYVHAAIKPKGADYHSRSRLNQWRPPTDCPKSDAPLSFRSRRP